MGNDHNNAHTGSTTDRKQGNGGEPAPVDLEKIMLQSRVQELDDRLRTVSTAHRQHQQEISGLRERLAQQARAEEEIRRGEVISALLDPVENLSRAIKASQNLPEETLRGLRMIQQSFAQALHKLGLEEVPAAGMKFDPSIHEAADTIPTLALAFDNVIAQVISTGYCIGNRLIRPARVVIYKYIKQP